MNEAIPHPRDVFDYLGGETVEAAFLSALARGRLHHAWLLTGPAGVGKATFAYRVARRLLGARPDPASGALGAAAEDQVSRLVAARAHPDLLVLQRDPEDGKTRKGIPVEEARGLAEFFSKSPGLAPWRVAIIDAADDLNRFGANAVLKILEEPPARGVILMVSARPGVLAPTLRSRCRRLSFRAPPADVAAPWLTERAEIAEGEARALLSIALGAPGRAWRLAALGGIEIDRAAGEILKAPPAGDDMAMLKLADSFRGAKGGERFDFLFERLAARVHAMASREAGEGEGRATPALDRWAQEWQRLVLLPPEVEAINLDRTDAFYTTLARLRDLA